MGFNNGGFSNLVYKIIGTPERWHNDYIDVMHQVLDDSDSIDAPENCTELKIGDQILSQISNTSEAMNAFGSLLDNGRFKMVILDSRFQVLYHNKTASELLSYLQTSVNDSQLNRIALQKISLAAEQNRKLAFEAKHGGLCAVDYLDQFGEQLYLRSIHSRNEIDGTISTHHLILVVDESAKDKSLNPQFVERYELTKKEQSVLLKLTHGQNQQEIADSSFVSYNTIKTHLNSLFRKTGAVSQADIIRMVLTDESQILDTYFGIRESILPLLKSPQEDKFLSLPNGHTIAYREYGPSDGDVIIFCHNGYGSRVTIPHDYHDVCTRLNKRVIIPERSGYGLTPYAAPEKWNSMLNQFIDLLEIKHYELMGAVLGSSVALNFASQADERLSRVRLCSPVFVNKASDTQYLKGIFAPVTRLIKASKHIALDIYKLWLKSITLNLTPHYAKMLKNSIGSAELEKFEAQDTVNLMIEGFRHGCSQGLDGIANDMVHCLSPRKVELGNISVPVDLWWGTEDGRVSLEGVENLAKQLEHSTLYVREGYSEHIYYALFEEIISAT